jgi:hypothetical protein
LLWEIDNYDNILYSHKSFDEWKNANVQIKSSPLKNSSSFTNLNNGESKCNTSELNSQDNNQNIENHHVGREIPRSNSVPIAVTLPKVDNDDYETSSQRFPSSMLSTSLTEQVLVQFSPLFCSSPKTPDSVKRMPSYDILDIIEKNVLN